MTVTVTDVAARADVSRSAIGRTFARGGAVSAEMRAKVEVAGRRTALIDVPGSDPELVACPCQLIERGSARPPPD